MGAKESPYGAKTLFGWKVNGPLGRLGGQKASTNYIKADIQLSQQFKQFCDYEFNENEKDSNTAMSRNDVKALKIMEESIELNDNQYQLILVFIYRNVVAIIANIDISVDRGLSLLIVDHSP